MTARVIVVATGKTGPSGVGNVALDDVNDVVITSPITGAILRYDGSNWVDADGSVYFDQAGAAATAQAAAIAAAAADATSKVDTHVNDTSAAHAATAIAFTPAGTVAATTVQAAIEEVASEASTASALGDLTDVDTAGVATGEVLTWDGTQWVSDPLTIDLSSAGAVSPATTDYVIGTDTSNSDANAKFLVSSLLALVTGTSAATTSAAGIVELATDAETITGTDTARAVTPANLTAKVASATASGIVELATDAETTTGTDTVRATTPANVKAAIDARVASTTAAGIVELATSAESITGTDTVRANTPAGGASAYQARQQAVNAQTGTTYTLVAADASKLVSLSNASAITLTLPQDSDATIAIGEYIDLYQLGAGQVTVVAGTGATLRVSGLTAKARAQYSRFGVQKVSANTFSLYGDLAAS